MTVDVKPTPMMAQWHECKKMAQDALLLFRMGDFYEAFYDDAILLAKELQLTLTKRQDIPMAGVPFHAAENYIDKLVSKGLRVAIAEQMEEPAKGKKLVRREVVRVVTPGTVVNSNLLDDKANNFLCSIHKGGDTFALAYVDITTADFRVTEFDSEKALLDELVRLRPTELLLSQKLQTKLQPLLTELTNSFPYSLTPADDWRFEAATTHPFLTDHFRVHNLDGYGLKGMTTAISAAGALLAYLQEQLCLPIEHIRDLRTYTTEGFMALDRVTLRNLELTESMQDGSKRNTLLELMDRTQTPMGGRLLRHWIKQPLLSVKAIQARQDSVAELLSSRLRLETLTSYLEKVRDLERLMMKVSAGYAGPRDLKTLEHSLRPLPQLTSSLAELDSLLIQHALQRIIDPTPVTNLIGNALVEEPPLRVSDGGLFQDGVNDELDELRGLQRNSREWLADYQASIREEYDIKTLKVGYNRVFGYYIEVSKGQADRMPESFTRRQTLTNAERFISPELKEFEQKILSAEDKISAIESDLFQQIRAQVGEHAEHVLQTGPSPGRNRLPTLPRHSRPRARLPATNST